MTGHFDRRTFCRYFQPWNLRGNNVAFGKIQVIGAGEYFQLPPVYNSHDSYSSNEYAFESTMWSHTFPHSVELHEVVRQSDPVCRISQQYSRRTNIRR